MYIFCCKDCVPPKRTPHCHSTCEDYIREKAEHDKKKAELDAKKYAAWSVQEYEIATAQKLRRRYYNSRRRNR